MIILGNQLYSMKNLFTAVCISLSLLAGINARAQNSSKAGDFYQISIYHTTNQAQLDSLSKYLQTQYVPRLHQAGFGKVGVFMPMANDTSADKRIIVWVPLANMEQVKKINYSPEAPAYARLETILLSAFVKAPQYHMPHLNGPAAQHIFELRSYESPTEERYISKEKMFNLGNEVDLFARLKFNAVFYARVLAGSRMPNLMYMTSFDNQQTHDEHWQAFNDDAEWKKLSGMAEYQKNVNKADIILMHPAPYSDVL